MSDAVPDAKRDIDAILASIRAELGVDNPVPVAASPTRRVGGLVHVESVEEGEEYFPSDRKHFAATDFDNLDELGFLRAAYRAVLGRDVDQSGLAHYLPALREGHVTPEQILLSLTTSPEGRARGVEITQLRSRPPVEFLLRLPKIGGALRRLRLYLNLPKNNRRLQKRIAASDRRHRETVVAINASLSSVRRSLQKLEQHSIEAQHRADQALAAAQEALDTRDNALAELGAARRQLTTQSAELGRLVEAARGSLAAPAAASLEVLEQSSTDSFYLAFENRFRGSTAVISERLKRYLPIAREAAPVAAGGTVLDIGCGRGEWLALLRDARINARGIDLNGAMAEHARGQGLAVEEGDAIAHLRNAAQGSLAAVTGFHIVEHLAFRDLLALFDNAFAALADEGFILFETPNPESLVVGACTFHYDPTHNKPLPPDLLRFIAESRGFVDVRIIRRDEDCRLDRTESGFVPAEVDDWFRQPADYAIYARKPAPEAAT